VKNSFSTHVFGKKCAILLIFVAKFQRFGTAPDPRWGGAQPREGHSPSPNPTSSIAPILLPPEHFYFPPVFGGLDETPVFRE